MKSVFVKIIISFIFFVGATIIQAFTWSKADYLPIGWPFNISGGSGLCLSESGCPSSSNIWALIADIVLWYLVLSLIMYIFNMIKRKK